MSKQDVWMPLYIADYLADTGHLSPMEHGIYLLLIMQYWRNGGLPADDVKLSRIARCTPDEWAACRDTIAEFFEPDWRHARIDREMAEAASNAERRAERARKAASARYSKDAASTTASTTSSNASSMPQACPSPSPSPSKSSEAKASDAPASPRDELFALVEPTAKQFGIYDKATRSLFGKAVKLAGGDHAAIVSLVRQALRDPPLELEPWLIAACTPKPFVQKIYGRNPIDGDDDGSQATSNRTDAALLGGAEGRGRDEPGFSNPGVGGLVQTALRRGA